VALKPTPAPFIFLFSIFRPVWTVSPSAVLPSHENLRPDREPGAISYLRDSPGRYPGKRRKGKPSSVLTHISLISFGYRDTFDDCKGKHTEQDKGQRKENTSWKTRRNCISWIISKKRTEICRRRFVAK